MRIASFIALAGLTLCAACTRESPHGGPGTAPVRNDSVHASPPALPPGDVHDASRTFTVSVPSGKTEVTQGDVEEFTVGINRGANFDESVRLKVKAPAGISVTPGVADVPRDMHDVKMAVSAAPDAPTGKATIEVIGIPESGEAVAVRMDLDIKRR